MPLFTNVGIVVVLPSGFGGVYFELVHYSHGTTTGEFMLGYRGLVIVVSF